MPGKYRTHTIEIDKLIHGGQGIGRLENGKRALVWGVLPGEKVVFKETKRRSDYVEGVSIETITPSPDRVEPQDELYLSTSPWQIMPYEVENRYKTEILQETMERAGVDFGADISVRWPKSQWNYRNKMEYSFFGDDTGLHLALFNRGSHQKQIVQGSSIARKEIDSTANRLCDILNQKNIRAGDLKSVIIRCDQNGNCALALFTRNENFPKINELSDVGKGIVVVYSNPKSPASVRTKDLYQFGDITLTDVLRGVEISYDVFSFFQVNVPAFSNVLEQIDPIVGPDKVIDMYSGVGSIGLCFPGTTHLVESDKANVDWAVLNAGQRAEVIYAPSEDAHEHIDSLHTVIVDPPRAGMHRNLIQALNNRKPPKIIYLSCNPSTQARDLKMLEEFYRIRSITGYNFFPRTPHIESLAVLMRR